MAKKSVKKTIKKKVSKKVVAKKPNLFCEMYKDSFDLLRDSKKYIYSVIGIFFFFVLIGFFVPIPEEYSRKLLLYFKQLVEQTKDYGAWKMTTFLFQNNVWASFIGFISGVFFGIFPLFNTISNGFVLGFAAKISVAENGIFSLWRLLPHGIFELPALFISLGMGIKLGVVTLFSRDWKKITAYFTKSFRTFMIVVVPLLVVAATIEGLLIVLSK